jgi:diketogulonate reductase-like aldo/keto reductase
VIAIPGTTSPAHLEEDFAARDVVLDEVLVARVDALMAPEAIAGPRYPAATQNEIDTEQFAFEEQA